LTTISEIKQPYANQPERRRQQIPSIERIIYEKNLILNPTTQQ
jgi:hypothetical protein